MTIAELAAALQNEIRAGNGSRQLFAFTSSKFIILGTVESRNEYEDTVALVVHSYDPVYNGREEDRFTPGDKTDSGPSSADYAEWRRLR